MALDDILQALMRTRRGFGARNVVEALAEPQTPAVDLSTWEEDTTPWQYTPPPTADDPNAPFPGSPRWGVNVALPHASKVARSMIEPMLPMRRTEGGLELAVPPMATQAMEAWNHFASGQNPQRGDEILAGATMTGGLGAIRPTGSLGMFGGRLAKTADHAKLAQAEELAAKGAPREQIWNETGWFQGPDQKWRFEIDDNPAFVKGAMSRDADEIARTFGDSVGDAVHHPELFAAYPETYGIGFEGQPGKGGQLRSGLLEGDTVALGRDLRGDATKSVALHELQHALQKSENFARGANDGDFTYQNSPLFSQRRSYESATDAYRRVAGEVEARNVQSRMNMNPDERRLTPPWKTQDTPDEAQIVHYGDSGRQDSLWDKVLGRSVAGAERAEASSGLPSSPVGAGSFDFTPGSPRSVEIGRTNLKYLPEDGAVELTALGTPEAYRGQGSATQAMQHFTGALDEAGLPSRLVARGDIGTDPARLQSFYAAHGYEAPGPDGYMVRPAKPTGETLFSNPKDAAPVGVLASLGRAEPAQSDLAFSANRKLDMSPEARMARARAMGFDTEAPLYHGSNATFDEFDLSKMGGTDWGFYGKGAYFTPSPDEAARYGKNVGEYYVRGKLAGDADAAAAWQQAKAEGIADPQAMKDRVNEILASQGFTGRDIDGVKTGTFGTEAVVFDPRNIRRSDAAFDPAQIDSANLLASNPPDAAPAGLLATGEGEEDDLPPIVRSLLGRAVPRHF